MTDDVLENQKDGDNTLKDTKPFKKQYAAILVQLNEVNEQACGFYDLMLSYVHFYS